MRLRLLVPLVAVALHAVPCAADELQLKNGDRLTGTAVSLAGGTLKFKTPHGDLDIAWPEVTALTVDETILVTTADGVPPTPRSGAIDIGATTALARPEPPIVWTGGANAGFLQTSGNTDINTLRLDADASARAGANRYTFGADMNRAEDDGEETARNWSLSGDYDRFLNPRLYLNANAVFTNDPFKDLDLRTALGGALGYQVLDTPMTKLSVEGGLGWVNEDFEVAEDDSYTALREGAKLDVLLVADRVTLFHQHDGYLGVTGDDNLFLKMKNGVRIALVAGLVTTLQWDLDYDRTPSPGRENTDLAFAFTFGYRF